MGFLKSAYSREPNRLNYNTDEQAVKKYLE